MNAPATQTTRPPIVVVMGHVDHGKSTLLDHIRHANTVAKEAGGITQHVAAYEVVRTRADSQEPAVNSQKRITFIDTPGHAAFQSIRSRGAHVADIAVLVVSADDGVKAQTLEALESIRGAGIPFVVAINKIDKPNADVMRTQNSLMEHGVFLEKLGGDTPWTAISAKTGAGVDELLDHILIVAEMEELAGNTNIAASGFVIEAHRDPKRGLAATLIITNGTLKSGMAVHAGLGIAPVRLMEDHTGYALREATFSTPVSLIGFDELPTVGETFQSFATKREAEAARDAHRSSVSSVPASVVAAEGRYLFPIVVRADTQGSLDAIALEVGKIGDEYAGVGIVQNGIGTISEGDIKAAIATHSAHPIVIGFNVGADATAHALAHQHGVAIEQCDIIYKMTERLEVLMKKAAPKRTIETVLGKARILKVFSQKREVHLVGCSLSEGVIARTAKVHITRRGEAIGDGTVINIQANRQNVAKVEAGSECGLEIETEALIAQGDTVEAFETTVV